LVLDEDRTANTMIIVVGKLVMEKLQTFSSSRFIPLGMINVTG